MNYERIYQTLKAKLTALSKSASVLLPNQRSTKQQEIEISVSITETDSNPYNEDETKHSISIDLLTSVPVSEGTQRIHHIVSKLVAAFDPLQQGDFWTDDMQHFIRIQSVSQKQANITGNRYQINVRILAIIHT